MFDLNKILRPNIAGLAPYSSARDEFSGKAEVYLDANENPFDTGLNRYPDPYSWEIKEKISKMRTCKPEQIVLGNGSDEVIDLLFRAFCTPGKDNIIILPPTYGMYQVYADINAIEVKKVPLTPAFEIDEQNLKSAINDNTKIIWICSPNNPTGNSLNPEVISDLLKSFQGIVVVDEAYIDFSSSQTWVDFLDFHPNLFVMQTFSKAWGLAGLRLGMGFGSKEIISILNKIKPPYNINTLTQNKALEVIDHLDEKNEKVDIILNERDKLAEKLQELSTVRKIYPSDANFLLVKIDHATEMYNALVEHSIIVRNRANVTLCEDCLRITVGTPKENERLVATLQEIIASKA